jgi:hypothetical protein
MFPRSGVSEVAGLGQDWENTNDAQQMIATNIPKGKEVKHEFNMLTVTLETIKLRQANNVERVQNSVQIKFMGIGASESCHAMGRVGS